MARPKLGEGETERLHVKITADEIEAIDEWRYTNRIPTRSEAVRRLIQIALATEEPTDSAGRLASDLMRIHTKAMTDENATADSLLDAIASPVLELAAHSKHIQSVKDALKAGETIEVANAELKKSKADRRLTLRLIERFVKGKTS